MPQKFDLEAALAKDVGPRRVVIYYIFIQLNILTKRFQPTSRRSLRRWEELKTRRDVRREYVPSIYADDVSSDRRETSGGSSPLAPSPRARAAWQQIA